MLTQMSQEEEDKLISVWKMLADLSKSNYPAVQAGCERARHEVWQVIFELGLKVDEGD